jgi:hypothetical protein
MAKRSAVPLPAIIQMKRHGIERVNELENSPRAPVCCLLSEAAANCGHL